MDNKSNNEDKSQEDEQNVDLDKQIDQIYGNLIFSIVLAYNINFMLVIIFAFSQQILQLSIRQINWHQLKLKGMDLLKVKKPQLTESMGIFSIVAYFSLSLIGYKINDIVLQVSMIGIQDDMYELKWIQKALLPGIISMIFLMSTSSINVVDAFLQSLIQCFVGNAININAGINGYEVGQALVIIVTLTQLHVDEEQQFVNWTVVLSTVLLWQDNRYPASIFVGDSFNFFIGAQISSLWNKQDQASIESITPFSESIMRLGVLFFPQLFNFIVSIPQLVGIDQCPKMRMPALKDSDNDKFIVGSRQEVDGGMKLNGTFINQMLEYQGWMSERRAVFLCMVIQVVFAIIYACMRVDSQHVVKVE